MATPTSQPDPDPTAPTAQFAAAAPAAGTARPPVAAVFTCDRCGEVACTVTLVPPGMTDPLAPPPDAPDYVPGKAGLFTGGFSVAVDGPVRITHGYGGDPGVGPGSLAAILNGGDPDALYEYNSELAPFRCRTCALNYCKACWRVWMNFDPDWPSWYEDTRGECPAGHVRLMDD